MPTEKERWLSIAAECCCMSRLQGKALERHWGRECTIQLNHQGHQCNESRSVLSKERQGEGRGSEGGGGMEERGVMGRVEREAGEGGWWRAAGQREGEIGNEADREYRMGG